MTQDAIVKNIISKELAEVTAQRVSACAHDCSKCGGGCSSLTNIQNTITVTANNLIGACVGDSVVIESATSKVLSAAALVYILPLVLLILGFITGSVLKLTEALSVALSIAAFFIGCWLTVLINKKLRRDRPLSYFIVSVKASCSDS
jgi:sigma-E factor negative regulatory protein RseC